MWGSAHGPRRDWSASHQRCGEWLATSSHHFLYLFVSGCMFLCDRCTMTHKESSRYEEGTRFGISVERVAQSNRLSKIFYANEACFQQLMRNKKRLKLVLWICHSHCSYLSRLSFFIKSTTTPVKSLDLHTINRLIQHTPLVLASLAKMCLKAFKMYKPVEKDCSSIP